MCVPNAEYFLNARRKRIRKYIDFYIHSLKNESSFNDVITLIASDVTTRKQAEKVSRKFKFNFIRYMYIAKLNGSY